MKKSKIALFFVSMLLAPSAFAAEITPYVGIGLVIDKANTSAKRVAFDASQIDGKQISELEAAMSKAFLPNAGGAMDFDMAFAGEITAGVSIDNFRAELEVAIRSASEDDYNIFSGDMNINIMQGMPFPIPAEIETATSVRHNSYLMNFFYDFNFGTRWSPYVGAGVGLGVYRQKATVEIDIDEEKVMAGIPGGGMGQFGLPPEAISAIQQFEQELSVADDTLYRFEWQVSTGVTYKFNQNWLMDLGYRFNSSIVGGEFVYAHELKLGARYMF